jgi:3'-phosphoadenosine 5'-phosphosulfate sulfotransferase (PAPS reductase)/FAD synthetase
MKRYPNCKIALQWWDNQNKGGEKSNFNILHNKLLREFMIENPPWFKISNRCCDGAKKLTLNKCYKEGGYDLTIYGVRKAENGARAFAYKNCFTEKNYKGHAEYRPIFWYSNDDRKEFEERFKIKHSACYGPEYGLQRTGCAGCSFVRDFEYELEVLRRQDPKLYKGVSNIFKDAYEYTRMYHRYQANNK